MNNQSGVYITFILNAISPNINTWVCDCGAIHREPVRHLRRCSNCNLFKCFNFVKNFELIESRKL